MPKYPKPRPDIPFDGTRCTRYDNGYILNKVVFTVCGSTELRIQFYYTPKKTASVEFYITNFKNYTAREVIVNINSFNATKGVMTTGEWGRHFEDGVLEVWHALGLSFGWMAPITTVWIKERNSFMREQRKIIAQETLKIQQQGFYNTKTHRIDISALQKHSEDASRLITPDKGNKLVKSLPPSDGSANVSYEVVNASTVQAITDTALTGEAVAVLNFASARNPGGGFLNGAMAQEEALAASSGLYNTQLRHMEYYEANRACRSMMYTDHAIYSPDVVFFRDSNFELLDKPVTASILTLPAVNMGQVRAKGEDVSRAKVVMKDRMRLSLAILAHERNDVIILGAYGCGVFGNAPNDVARWWQELLSDEKYECYFRRVLFVVLDKPSGQNIRAFERVFGR